MTLPVHLHESLSRERKTKKGSHYRHKDTELTNKRKNRDRERTGVKTKRREDTIHPSRSPPLSLVLSFFLSLSPVVRHSSSAERSRRRATTTCMCVCAFVSKRKHVFLKHNRENKWGLFVVEAGLGVLIGPGPTSSRPSYAMTDMKRGWWLLAKWDR